MMTVHEVSKLTGVSIRALHHYDRIGLLHPARVTDAGYRLYDETDLERLQCILLFKELQFPLKEIRRILDSPTFDRGLALEQQITLLQMKAEHLKRLIELAREIQRTGVKKLDFTPFDTKKMDAYAQQAKEQWGDTSAYREYEKRSEGRSQEEERALGDEMMKLFAGFGQLLGAVPSDARVQRQVKALQDYISEHFYTCTDEILAALGQMYAAGGDMTENINRAGGTGAAEFVAEAIAIYCKKAAER